MAQAINRLHILERELRTSRTNLQQVAQRPRLGGIHVARKDLEGVRRIAGGRNTACAADYCLQSLHIRRLPLVRLSYVGLAEANPPIVRQISGLRRFSGFANPRQPQPAIKLRESNP